MKEQTGPVKMMMFGLSFLAKSFYTKSASFVEFQSWNWVAQNQVLSQFTL